MDQLPINSPDIRTFERDNLLRALDGLVAGDRTVVDRLEEVAASALNRPHAVSATSAGIGIEAALRALELEPGDEVICPAYAPIRLVNGILRSGATPRFVDVQPRSGGVDTDRLESVVSNQTRAIAVAPTWFDPSILEATASFSRKYELHLVEDAVDSVGSTFGSDGAGRFGVISVIGFGIASPAFAAGGGLVLTNKRSIAERCRILLREGRASSDELGDFGQHGWMVQPGGIDGRLDPLRAAVAIGVLERLEDAVARRQAIADAYVARLGGESELSIPAPDAAARPSWPAFPVRLDERYVSEDRDAILAGLRRHDIVASRGWGFGPRLTGRAMTGYPEDEWPIAARLAARTIHLPCHPAMEQRDVDLVCQTLLLMMQQNTFTRGD